MTRTAKHPATVSPAIRKQLAREPVIESVYAIKPLTFGEIIGVSCVLGLSAAVGIGFLFLIGRLLWLLPGVLSGGCVK